MKAQIMILNVQINATKDLAASFLDDKDYANYDMAIAEVKSLASRRDELEITATPPSHFAEWDLSELDV